MLINGPNYPEALRGQISMFKKCVMINDLEVQGAISAGGLSVLTTGTGYIKSQTYSTAQTTDLLAALKTYTDTQLALVEPSFVTVSPVLKNLNLDTGKIEIILDPEFVVAALTPTDFSAFDADLAKKADKTTTYTKTATDDLFIAYDPVIIEAPVEKI